MPKSAFFKEMRELIYEYNPKMNEKEKSDLESTLRSLYSFFDIDSNGILDYQEVCAALVILCKGSVPNKISFAMRVFSTSDTKDLIQIDFREFKRLVHFIFKLCLETSTEILLDYDLEKLATSVV